MSEQSETNMQPFWAKKGDEEVKLSRTHLLSHHTSHIAYDYSLHFRLDKYVYSASKRCELIPCRSGHIK